MGTTHTSNMDKTAELATRFAKIDSNSNGTLEFSELETVFGEHAEEFLKFCDGAEKDRVLTPEEFCAGVIGDTADLSDEAFRTTWLDRMDGCIAAAGAAPSETVSQTECTLECQVVQLSPYFEIIDLEAFKAIWQEDYKEFAHKEDCCNYAFTFSEDGTKAHCREAYWNADAFNQHITDVAGEGGPFPRCLDEKIAKLDHLECHGPAAELDKIKAGPHKGLPFTYFTCEWGFRAARAAMEEDTVCHLYPYFAVKDVAAFKQIWKDAYAATQANAEAEKSHQYAFSFSTDGDGNTTASCRESYADGASLKLHIDNVLGPFGACLAPEVAELDRIEIHAPAAELPTIKEHGALQANEAKMQYSEIGWGFRNATV